MRHHSRFPYLPEVRTGLRLSYLSLVQRTETFEYACWYICAQKCLSVSRGGGKPVTTRRTCLFRKRLHWNMAACIKYMILLVFNALKLQPARLEKKNLYSVIFPKTLTLGQQYTTIVLANSKLFHYWVDALEKKKKSLGLLYRSPCINLSFRVIIPLTRIFTLCVRLS